MNLIGEKFRAGGISDYNSVIIDGSLKDFVKYSRMKKIFGATVKARRKHLGISQEELAERADLHRTYISDVERGARNLSLESIVKIAHALDTSCSELFSGIN